MTKILNIENKSPLDTTLLDADDNAISSSNPLYTSAFITSENNIDRHVWVSPANSLSVNTVVRLVGTNFDGAEKDPNYWTETVTNGGTVVQSGQIKLNTNTNGTGGNGTAKYVSVRKARYVVGAPNRFLGFAAITTAPIADNLKRFGAYDDNAGYFFQLTGTVFSVCTRNLTEDTVVASGDFDGNYGDTWNPVTGQMYKYEIEYGEYGVYFYINDIVLHKIVLVEETREPLTSTLTLPITIENNNINGNDVASTIRMDGATILRHGELITKPQFYYHATATTAGVNLKIGSGAIHGVIISNIANNAVITLSDSITTITPTMFQLTSAAQTQPSSIDMKGLPFYNGLRLTISGAAASVVVIYE